MHGDARISLDLDDGRYHRQSLISWWDQDLLTAAVVLVVGAGALGNELMKGLALLGVGTIVVVDLDVVENSNLSRCVLFREEDEGRPKVDAAADALHALNPDVRVVPIRGDVRTTIGLAAFERFDVVLGGLDNREARLHVNQACWKVGTPWIDGAIEGLMGVMRVFVPPGDACYECTLTARDYELLDKRRACSLLSRGEMLDGRTPTTVTSASVIAGMQVQEAVRLLHADRVVQFGGGRGVVYNGLTHDSYVVEYRRNEDCLSHDDYLLDAATAVPLETTFGELLGMAAAELGGGAVLDLEREIVTAFTCAACGSSEYLYRSIERVVQGDALCDSCGAPRQPALVHVVSAADEAMLTRSPADLGLPSYEVVTGRHGERRHHFVCAGSPTDPLHAALGAVL